MFYKTWFRKNQDTLLRLLNMPLAGTLVRRVLKIKRNEKVAFITPSAVSYDIGNGEYEAEFLTRNLYAELIQKRIGWLLKLMHQWDMKVANQWMPSLNLGYDYYTEVTVQVGDGGTVDGWTRWEGSELQFNDAVTQNGTTYSSSDTQMAAYIRSGTTGGYYIEVGRMEMNFDTTALDPAWYIFAAVLNLRRTSTAVGLDKTDFVVVEGTYADEDIVWPADHQQASRSGYAARVDFDVMQDNTDVDLRLATSYVNGGGYTKLMAMLGWDYDINFNGSWRSDRSTSIIVDTSNVSGSTTPSLYIKYRFADDIDQEQQIMII